MENYFKNLKVPKGLQELNAGSMADIAFLLLIFFLVTTTLNNELGIMRKLPPDIKPPDTPVKKRNVMEVWINRENKLMINGNLTDIRELRQKAKAFVANKDKDKNLPEIEKIYIEELGSVDASKKHIISLMSDRGTRYSTYIAVQNELTAAYNELRDEYALKTFQIKYADLNNQKKKAVEEVYPLHISEAEPKAKEDLQ